jgi:hypothetical protein
MAACLAIAAIADGTDDRIADRLTPDATALASDNPQITIHKPNLLGACAGSGLAGIDTRGSS